MQHVGAGGRLAQPTSKVYNVQPYNISFRADISNSPFLSVFVPGLQVNQPIHAEGGDAAQKDGGASITSEEERTGYIIVVKPTLIDDKDETVDVRQYRRENKDFPQQSTSDQWFDESQFESYRKLGALSVEQILNDGKAFGWRQQSDRAGKPARPAEGEENIDSADVIRNLRQGQPPDPDEMWALFRTMYTQSQQERDKK